jgi:hypothetical protein
MNKFYNQPILLQWVEAILLLIIGFYPALLIIEASYTNPIFYLLFILYIPIGQFSYTPIFRLTGVYQYYSPMLLGYMPNNNQIDLHSGGSFDYLFVMTKYKPGLNFKFRIITFHTEGLLNIISKIESNKIPGTVIIHGTSYFFNDRTLTKLGFELIKPSYFYRLNLLVNFIDLVWMYSFSKGKVSIPSVWNAKKASITGYDLVQKKEIITELYNKYKVKL